MNWLLIAGLILVLNLGFVLGAWWKVRGDVFCTCGHLWIRVCPQCDWVEA